VLGSLGKGVDGAPGCAEELPRTCPNLARHEERHKGVNRTLEVCVSVDQVVLVTSIGIPCGIGVVAVEVDVAPDTFLGEASFSRFDKTLQNPLASSVMSNDVVEAVAFGGCVLGMAPDIEIQPCAVLKEDV